MSSPLMFCGVCVSCVIFFLRSGSFANFSLCVSELSIRVITKLPNTEQSSKGKGKTHKSTNRQNQSTTGKLGKLQFLTANPSGEY